VSVLVVARRRAGCGRGERGDAAVLSSAYMPMMTQEQRPQVNHRGSYRARPRRLLSSHRCPTRADPRRSVSTLPLNVATAAQCRHCRSVSPLPLSVATAAQCRHCRSVPSRDTAVSPLPGRRSRGDQRLQAGGASPTSAACGAPTPQRYTWSSYDLTLPSILPMKGCPMSHASSTAQTVLCFL